MTGDGADSGCRRKVFKELSLWLIFKRLVDAMSVMEYGNEYTFNRRTKRHEVRPVAGNQSMIHFDAKPDNSRLSVLQ